MCMVSQIRHGIVRGPTWDSSRHLVAPELAVVVFNARAGAARRAIVERRFGNGRHVVAVVACGGENPVGPTQRRAGRGPAPSWDSGGQGGARQRTAAVSDGGARCTEGGVNRGRAGRCSLPAASAQGLDDTSRVACQGA